jgi:hypothetical protein
MISNLTGPVHASMRAVPGLTAEYHLTLRAGLARLVFWSGVHQLFLTVHFCVDTSRI